MLSLIFLFYFFFGFTKKKNFSQKFTDKSKEELGIICVNIIASCICSDRFTRRSSKSAVEYSTGLADTVDILASKSE